MKHTVMLSDKDAIRLVDKHVDYAKDLAHKLEKHPSEEMKVEMLDELHEGVTLALQVLRAHKYSPTQE